MSISKDNFMKESKLMSIFSRLIQKVTRNPHLSTQRWWSIFALVGITTLFTVPVFIHRTNIPGNGDFGDHLRFTVYLLTHQTQKIPPHILAHLFYQLLIAVLYHLVFRLKISLNAVAIFVVAVGQTMTALTIYFWLGRSTHARSELFRFGAAFTLIFVAPIMAFVFWDGYYYLGYIGIANYHNPTILLLRPIALLSFFYAIRVFSSSRNSWGSVFLSSLLVLVSAYIKPNYLFCILPTLGLMTLVYVIWKKQVDWRMLIFGFIVPGVLILLIQWTVTYYLPGGDNTIMFSLFGVMRSYSNYLVPKLLFSVIFPIVVLVFNFRAILRDKAMLLAWLGFIVSLGPSYFLAEKARFSSGNFIWGSEIMSLILFITSVRFVYQAKFQTNSWLRSEKAAIYLSYAAHVVAGIVFYVYVFQFAAGSPL